MLFWCLSFLRSEIEGSGLPDTFRKNTLSIPISDHVESLNAAAATAIALYEWSAGKAP